VDHEVDIVTSYSNQHFSGESASSTRFQTLAMFRFQTNLQVGRISRLFLKPCHVPIASNFQISNSTHVSIKIFEKDFMKSRCFHKAF